MALLQTQGHWGTHFLTASVVGSIMVNAGSLTVWRERHFLLLSVSKAREFAVDFCRKRERVLPIRIAGSEVETVD